MISQNSERYYKTRPCNKLLTTGKCINLSTCSYAHDAYELRHPRCLSYTNCHNVDCSFIHSHETVDEFRKRTRFVIPKFQPDVDDYDDDDENVEIIIDTHGGNVSDTNCTNFKSYVSLRPVILDRLNPMSFYWGTMANWSKRNTKWV